MSEDDVLRGVRAAREAFARAHGFDPYAMVAALRALDAAGDWPIVRLDPHETAGVASAELHAHCGRDPSAADRSGVPAGGV